MADALLEAAAASREFGGLTAVDGVSLTVAPGEIVGLLGANGAGKTTLVRQMVNLLRPTSGQISLFGEPIAGELLHIPTHVGYMPQETHSLNTLTVGEALYFTAHLRGKSRSGARQERDRLLELWQITHPSDKDNSRMSLKTKLEALTIKHSTYRRERR